MYNLIVTLIMCTCSLLSVAYAANLHDPTRPPDAATSYEPSGSNLQIDAIFFNKDSGNSTAIIEGKKFMVGDKVMAATIIEIKPHEIKFKDDHGEFTILMPYTTIKSPATKNNKKKNS